MESIKLFLKQFFCKHTITTIVHIDLQKDRYAEVKCDNCNQHFFYDL